jgi:uncharacterized DUF497 family protein
MRFEFDPRKSASNRLKHGIEPVIKRVNVDFPAHMLAMLDREAEIRGINRQALIKTWLYDRLMQSQTK